MWYKTREAIDQRIAHIDTMFEGAKSWGSWMWTAAGERAELVNRLQKEYDIIIPHRYERSVGG